jgi:hypothetical protein
MIATVRPRLDVAVVDRHDDVAGPQPGALREGVSRTTAGDQGSARRQRAAPAEAAMNFCAVEVSDIAQRNTDIRMLHVPFNRARTSAARDWSAPHNHQLPPGPAMSAARPTTSPSIHSEARPELPGFTLASVCGNLGRHALAGLQRPRPLMMPAVIDVRGRGAADGQHPLADLGAVGTPKRAAERSAGGAQAHHRDIAGASVHDVGRQSPPVREDALDVNRRGAIKDVIARHDVSARVDDDAQAVRAARRLNLDAHHRGRWRATLANARASSVPSP